MPTQDREEPVVRLEVLGPLRVVAADGTPSGLTGLPALLFVYLVTRGGCIARSELTALFWPEAEASRGRHGLRQALSRIRQTVGHDLLIGTDPIGVDPDRIESDADLLHAALDRGEVTQALGLWRGPFLNGDADGHGWEYSEWVEVRRRELEALLLDAGRGAVRARMAADEFAAALELVERLAACVPGEAGLAMDAAELLLELGRPHEAVARLDAAGLDADGHPRAAAILRRAARVEPEPAAEPVVLAAAEAADRGDVDPAVADRGGVDPAATTVTATTAVGMASTAKAKAVATAEPTGRRRWTGRWVAGWVAGGVVALGGLVATVGWALRPVPLPQATVHFCAHRDTQYGFAMGFPEGSLDGVVTEPVCPIVPLGRDSLLVFGPDGEGGTEVVVQVGLERRVVYRNEGRLGPTSSPLRRAGAEDGIVSPDGRRVLLAVERIDRPRPRDTTLPPLPEEGAVPGVAGLRSDPSFDWDVVLLDLVTGEERSIGDPEANVRDARFTPDGDAVVFVSDATGNGDLHRMDLATGATTQLTTDPRMARAPVVGRRWTVFWIGSGTDADPEDVAVLDNATGEVRLLHPGPWDQAGPILSPDERRVCWTSKRLGHFEGDIAVADVDGSGQPRILRSPGRDDGCQWLGPDHLLFTSWRTGQGQLFLQSLGRGGEAENLTPWAEGVHAPVVSLGR